jgi:hypothetical protein
MRTKTFLTTITTFALTTGILAGANAVTITPEPEPIQVATVAPAVTESVTAPRMAYWTVGEIEAEATAPEPVAEAPTPTYAPASDWTPEQDAAHDKWLHDLETAESKEEQAAAPAEPIILPSITLPSCLTDETGDHVPNCYWDASEQGNRGGTDFVWLNGVIFYPGN